MQEVDLVLRNAKYLDADKREFVEGDIAIKDGKIVGINGIFYDKNNIKKLCDIWAKDAKNAHYLTKNILKKEKIYKTSVSITAQLLSPFL